MIDLLIFAGKFLIVFIFIAGLVSLVAFLIAKNQQPQELEIESLSEKFDQTQAFFETYHLSKDELKAFNKKKKQEKKDKKKSDKKKIDIATIDKKIDRKVLYVLDFDGDIKASQVNSLREEVNAILQGSKPMDEVLCRLESPGGIVNGYGLASSQLLRLRQAGLHLTVAVDQVAASGGYLMSCVANQIISAPFAIVGSIGVVAQVPNFNRFLKKWDVDFKEYTAGEFKRTVSILGEITPKGEEKFKEQLEETHDLFKNYVHQFRPNLDIAKIATGEHWYGENALKLGLIDNIQTSDEFLLKKFADGYSILKIHFKKNRSMQEKLADLVGSSLEKVGLRLISKLEKQKYI